MNYELLLVFNNIHHLVLAILLLLFSTQFLVSHCSSSCHDDERAALLTFKSSLTDPWNRLSSWKEGGNCCNWYGIKCSHDSYHVVSLDLRNTYLEKYSYEAFEARKLKGTISPSLFNLTNLQYLDLSGNNFQDSKIPHGFDDLKHLTYLNLSYSLFSGSITTQFANLSSLQYLDMSDSYLVSSTDVSWLKGLVNLKVLNLASVDLSVASSTAAMNWAKPISYLSQLRLLDFSGCGIFSPIPGNEFLNLSGLSSLRMSNNYDLVNSSIPLQFANLTSLSVLDLSGCKLQGSTSYLPHQLKELYLYGNTNLIVNLTWMFDHHEWPKLQTLSISNTKVNGPIPSSISNASLLVSLLASSCSIQGSIPNSISNLSQLQHLDISMNSGLTGYLHSLISNLRNLNYLDLSSNMDLQGSIPESICQNSLLQSVRLSNNKLTGTIPSCIGKLRHLQYFNVRDNSIGGTIPSCIGNLRHLEEFDVGHNSIGGTVSLIPLINNLNLLRRLDLSSNRITVETGFYIQTLPSKPQLQTLRLNSCNWRGYIPDSICDLTELSELDLSDNSITGVNLTCIFKLPKLFYLDISSNNLQGKLPIHLTKYSFKTLNLANNSLRGPLHLPSLKIEFLDLSNNKFTGEISTKMGERLSQIAYVSLSSNKLSGSIPLSICSKALMEPQLQHLDLSNNELSGKIPSSLGHCVSLTSLNLGRNNLIGNIPNELGRAINLKYLQFSNNFLNGTFPTFVQRLEKLEVISLGNNNFEGGIPTFIDSLFNLVIFSLRSNQFNGSIPKEITRLRNLQILDLSYNKLLSSIPKKIGELGMLTTRNKSLEYLNTSSIVGKKFTSVQLEMVSKGGMREFVFESNYRSGIDLSCNNLDGKIPEQMGQLIELSLLNLSHNQLSGKIPMNIGNMTGLESLDLSFNRLFGRIPQSLTWINYLGTLNLSYNNLSGMIPSEPHFDTLSVDGSAYIGNDLLCGFPTNISCYLNNSTDISVQKDYNDDDEEDARQKILFYGVVFLGFGVGFWGLFLVLLLRKEKWWFGYWKVVDKIAERMLGCISKH